MDTLTLPESRSAEAALLGSMILDPRIIPDMAHIAADMFLQDEHRILVRTIRQIYERHKGRGVDGLLVRNELDASKQLDNFGGVEYLQQVIGSVPSSASAEYYARIVRAKALRRAAIDVGHKIITEAMEYATDDEEAILEAVTQPMSQIHNAFTHSRADGDIQGALMEAYAQLENPLGCRIKTPWFGLEKYVPGFKPGQVVVVAGRPGMGKSAFTLHLTLKACACGAHIMFISFEMPRIEMANRTMSAIANVPLWKFDHPKRDLTAEDFNAITESLGAIVEYDLEICDAVAPTPLAVKNACRVAHRKKPLDAIVVDYLQRMHCGQKRATRDWEVTTISNELKNMALELDVPVFVLSQLNRQCESRDNKRPRMSDLRDSGSVEQDADIILGLYRDDEYGHLKEGYEPTGVAEVIVLKHRNGPAHKTAYLQFWPGTMTFHDRASEEVSYGNDPL